MFKKFFWKNFFKALTAIKLKSTQRRSVFTLKKNQMAEIGRFSCIDNQ